MLDMGQDVLNKLRPEFLRATHASLEDCEELISRVDAEKIGGAEALVDLKRRLHNIKGQASTFGFPTISKIAHLLEDRLDDIQELHRIYLRPTDAYLIAMDKIIRAGVDPGDQEARRLLDSLPPLTAPLPTTPPDSTHPKVLTVLVSSTIEAIIRARLSALPIQLEAARSPAEGLIDALRRPPALVIASLVMEELSGIEIACALRAVTRTRRLPVVLCGSRRGRGSDLSDLPAGVPVLDTSELINDSEFPEMIERMLRRRISIPQTG